MRIPAAALALLLTVGPIVAYPGRAAAAPADVTADIQANRDVVLSGDAVVRLTGGTTTYTGVISGTGTFTVSGSGTLVLTRDSDFTLPADRRHQKLVTYNGNHPLTRLDDPDPPAVVVEKGAALQYGADNGTTGQITHYQAIPGGNWNLLNVRVDGTLDLAVRKSIHLGVMSGGGVIQQRRFTWTSLDLAGKHPFSGVLVVGSGFAYGTNAWLTALPNVKTIVDDGSAIHSAPDGTVITSSADYYSRQYGNDINFHSWGSGAVRMTGVYSYFDRGSITAPKLSDASLNVTAIPHDLNKRGINIEGANVEWGDGTTSRFFLPGTARTAYVNLHFDGRERSRLTFNYNGPVTMGVPISGGKYHDTLAAPGQGDVVLAATPGNQVTFAAPQNYDGSTTIGAGATLRLGDGSSSGDSSLRLGGRYRIVDNGTLVVQNTRTPITLSKISGSGSLRQAGAATLTLAGQTTYAGPTVIERGTLKLTAGSLASSSGADLTGEASKLDLTRAGAQTIKDFAGVTGSVVAIGGPLTVGASASTSFGGTITGAGGLVKTGTGTLTLTGSAHTQAPWTVRQGALRLEPGSTHAAVTVDNGATVDARGATLTGDYTQNSGATLIGGGLTVAGHATVAGTLTVPPEADPAKSITVLDNTSTARITGTFDGLPEGATLDGRTITYAGGDGNDVVLSPSGSATTGRLLPALGGGPSSWAGYAVGITVILVGITVAVAYLRRRKRAAVG
jgi:autotransporter-associated beta strand protein